MVDREALIQKARSVVNKRQLSKTVKVGGVGSALVTDKGNVYTGVSLDVACGIGFCAEHTAIGNMITNGESRIQAVVAFHDEEIRAPCGRCRELMYQINHGNADTNILLEGDRQATLKELLPEHWYIED